MGEKLENIIFAFLMERLETPIAYHDLERELPEYALHKYNKTFGAQTIGRKFRLLVERQPIPISERKAMTIKEFGTLKREKKWIAKIQTYNTDLFGNIEMEDSDGSNLDKN